MTPGAVTLLLVSALARGAAAAEPSVKAAASKSEVTIGEPFTVELEASGPEGTTWRFPAEAGTEQVELRTPQEPSASAATTPARHRYEAAVFALGEVEVPPIVVRFRLPDGTEGEAATEPIPLRILSLLPKDPQQQALVDIRDPLELSIGSAFFVALGGVLLALGALGFWLWKRAHWLESRAAAPPADVPAELEARQALDALQSAGLLAEGDYREFYIRIAVIAKRYLERRLAAPVLEMTSSEMASFLRDHPQGAALLGDARDVVGAADRVKFARGAAVLEEAERHLGACRKLVDDLEARLQPAAPAAEPRERVA